MKKTGIRLWAACLVALSLTPAVSQASIILAQWTLETNTPADLTNSAVGPVVIAEAGIMGGQLGGVHVKSASDWTTPSGNGSANSYSVNEWTVGDYTQISTSTVGYNTISLTFDATSSSTGPRDFKVQTSTDGSTFVDSGFTYAVVVNASPNPTWNATIPSPIYTITTNLPVSVENQAAIFVRLVNTTTVSANGGVVATGGTSRLDNVTISGEQIPEPASIALMFGCLGILALRRS
jgi:hypothetical protein